MELTGRILVTGGEGFLGKRLVRTLREQYECLDVVSTRHRCGGWWDGSESIDLLCPQAVMDLVGGMGPFDYVFHLAGRNGGLLLNQAQPADLYRDNTLMDMNVLEACRKHKVRKVLGVVASCAYPGYVDTPLWETRFFEGWPHPSVEGHGLAKRNLQAMCRLYNKQYGLNAVCACPTTLYGPGQELDEKKLKVVHTLIVKFLRAGKGPVQLLGTGTALRELLYVGDAARLLVECMLHYDNPGFPINLGTGQEVSIRELAERIAKLTGYQGEILWGKPEEDGQHRKRLDLAKMRRTLPAFATIPLEEGLARTVAYYAREVGK